MTAPHPTSSRTTRVVRPLLASRVEAGFPSPADDHVERSLDLNEELIPHPAATFFLRAGGSSMLGAGIHDGDLLVVDRALDAAPGRVVVAVVDGEFTVKRLTRTPRGLTLTAEHPGYPPIACGPETEVSIWGVVRSVIHEP